jgi:hypothetical protein
MEFFNLVPNANGDIILKIKDNYILEILENNTIKIKNKVITINDKEINVATIDTMLSFYLAFIYADKPFPYFNKDRILCMAEFLFNVEQENRLEQRGLLKRFSLECYGKQPTLESIRAEKAEKFKELSGKRGTREFEEWFLKYTPNALKEKMEKEENKSKKTVKNVEKKKQTRKRRKTNFLNIF